ncbi:MAG: barstar family protein [Deltaproteobacteria bacterium]
MTQTATENGLEPLRATAPWLRRWMAGDAEAHTALWRLRGETAGKELFIGSLRGWKMRERQGVFDQFGALLQFPRYFGGNWNAFVDCLGDLDWLRASGFLLVLMDAGDVLRDGDPDEFGLLLRLLEQTAEAFAAVTEFRPALPFHVLLHATPERATELEERLAAEGRALPLLESWPPAQNARSAPSTA